MAKLATKRSASPAAGNSNGNGSGNASTNATPVAAASVPFVASAHEYTEYAWQIVRQLDGVQSHQEPVQEIPAYGFYRDMFLEVVATGGVLGEGVAHPDAPFNVIQTISMEDVNSTPIMGPLTGWQLLYANIVNGGAYKQDPRSNPLYETGVNFAFFIRIPQEIYHHNAMGALPNENASSTYKVKITTNIGSGATGVFTTAPTTLPSVSISGTLEAWTQPADTNYEGTPQAQNPPAVGTAQFFSANTVPVNAGNINPRLVKVGNLIRSIVIECRDSSGARNDAVMPNPMRFTWDQRNIYNHSLNMQRTLQWERITDLASIDEGMYILSFDHLNMGRQGDGDPFLWWPTVQSSRIELDGNNSEAGTITFMTNDIAPAEILPSERYVLTSQTGFHPAMYAGNPTTS
jgi:hypothetical protein